MRNPVPWKKILLTALMSNPFWWFLTWVFFKEEPRPWVDETLTASQNTIAHIVSAVLAVPTFVLVGIGLALIVAIRPSVLTSLGARLAKMRTKPLSHDTRITPQTGKIVINPPISPSDPPQGPEPTGAQMSAAVVGKVSMSADLTTAPWGDDMEAANDTDAWVAVEAQSRPVANSPMPPAANDSMPPGWPVGNSSAAVMANQPPIQRPHMQPVFINSSNHQMAWYAEELRRQHEAAVFAMRTTMPKFNPATLSTAS